MADVKGALPLSERVDLRNSLSNISDPFISALPKVELHVHIEGLITPELKWKFSQRNGQTLTHPRTRATFSTLEELQDSHDPIKFRDDGGSGDRMNNSEETLSFFEAYYGGFEVLKTKRDYFDLAMHYFERVKGMNMRYCELFFDPQGHTNVGTKWETMMGGFREAMEMAEREMDIKSAWIMCFLRDLSPESAMEHYLAALPYRDMIAGIGLDSNEDGRPPLMFEEVFARARRDGFKITAHCDVGKTYPLDHVQQTVSVIGGTGADRVDHGLNVTDSPELMQAIREKDLGLTICPWSYIRHQPFDDVFARIRTLYEAGITMSIGSDDPAFMEDTWVWENLLVVKQYCNFSNENITKVMTGAVEMCWAPETVKRGILEEMKKACKEHSVAFPMP